MIRPKGKPQKIAYSILGVPSPFKTKRKRRNENEKRLQYEETSRSK